MKDVKIIIDGTVYKVVSTPNGEYANCTQCAMSEKGCWAFDECLCDLAVEDKSEIMYSIFVEEQ